MGKWWDKITKDSPSWKKAEKAPSPWWLLVALVGLVGFIASMKSMWNDGIGAKMGNRTPTKNAVNGQEKRVKKHKEQINND